MNSHIGARRERQMPKQWRHKGELLDVDCPPTMKEGNKMIYFEFNMKNAIYGKNICILYKNMTLLFTSILGNRRTCGWCPFAIFPFPLIISKQLLPVRFSPILPPPLHPFCCWWFNCDNFRVFVSKGAECLCCNVPIPFSKEYSESMPNSFLVKIPGKIAEKWTHFVGSLSFHLRWPMMNLLCRQKCAPCGKYVPLNRPPLYGLGPN